MPPLLGIFGGTFNPPHYGHLALARAAYQQLGLQRLLWVPTPEPPHKQEQAILSTEHRLAMVRLALKNHPQYEISTLEFERPGPHYTLDTVKILAEQNPGMALVYLMGGDSLRDLPTWHRPADLIASLHFIGVMRRPGDAVDLSSLEACLPGLTAKIRFVEAPLVNISSSDIRRRAAEGRPFRRLVPAAVFRYIVTHHLYQ